MAGTGSYDTREAEQILGTAHARAFGHPKLDDATQALLKALEKTANRAGFEARTDERGLLRVQWGSKPGCVFQPFGRGLQVRPVREGAPFKEVEGIEFDAITGAFVGKAVDECVAPTPGELRARRSAVAVLADCVVRLLEEAT